jgi:predicted RNA-binding protein
MSDVTSLQKIIAKLITTESLGENAEVNADVSKDGELQMEDVVLIQKYIAELIKEF